MLIEALQKYCDAEKRLWEELNNDKDKQYFIDNANVSEATLLIEDLFRYIRIVTPATFELLLKIDKDAALTFIKKYYLWQDLANYSDNRVYDLKMMFTNIKNILGENELNKILKSKKFLPVNKRNKKVKEAIKFALNED